MGTRPYCPLCPPLYRPLPFSSRFLHILTFCSVTLHRCYCLFTVIFNKCLNFDNCHGMPVFGGSLGGVWDQVFCHVALPCHIGWACLPCWPLWLLGHTGRHWPLRSLPVPSHVAMGRVTSAGIQTLIYWKAWGLFSPGSHVWFRPSAGGRDYWGWLHGGRGGRSCKGGCHCPQDFKGLGEEGGESLT